MNKNILKLIMTLALFSHASPASFARHIAGFVAKQGQEVEFKGIDDKKQAMEKARSYILGNSLVHNHIIISAKPQIYKLNYKYAGIAEHGR